MSHLKTVTLLMLASLAAACGNSDAVDVTDATDVTKSEQTAVVAYLEDGMLVVPERSKAETKPIPKFAEFKDVKVKKQTFFDYMNERVKLANDEVWQERMFLLAAQDKFRAGRLADEEVEQIRLLGQFYDLPPPELMNEDYLDELLVRVDVVPASLILAQAANESGWGTSRFALQGRNFFGIWCYQPGCGIPPSRRNSGSKHEVRKFSSVMEGVRFYLHNINIGHAYEDLRALRAEVRAQDAKPTGMQLAGGLSRYSERGQEYVDEIRSMIDYNNLASYSVKRQATTQ